MPRSKTSTELKPGSVAFRVMEQLKLGQWTTRQLAERVGWSVRYVASVVSQFRKLKIAYRIAFTIHQGGDHGGPQAIYAAGWGKEARQPRRVTPLGSWRRYKERIKLKRKTRAISSVFNLAEGIDKRERRSKCR
jgi:hypothetical protein